MKPNRRKCTNNRQLNTKQPLRWVQKDNEIRENNDSSKSHTLTLLHSWAKTKKQSEAKQGQHKQNKERYEKDTNKQIRKRQMETHTTISEHHPSISKHVKNSINSKSKLKAT